MTILDEIVAKRKVRILEDKSLLSLNDLKSRVLEKKDSGYKPESFFKKSIVKKTPFLISEIKKASPSKGIIRDDFDVSMIAKSYMESEYVNAISVLCEPDFFKGHYDNLLIAKSEGTKTLLLKDFIIDEYQIYRGFFNGASAFLLIASILSDEEILSYKKMADDLDMQILFEVHDKEEFKRALNLSMPLIGINNRDLKTFKTDIRTTAHIISHFSIPENVKVISESGINNRDDIKFLLDSGADGFLIGEQFMKQKDITYAIKELME